jgi:hypothetical protein
MNPRPVLPTIAEHDRGPHVRLELEERVRDPVRGARPGTGSIGVGLRPRTRGLVDGLEAAQRQRVDALGEQPPEEAEGVDRDSPAEPTAFRPGTARSTASPRTTSGIAARARPLPARSDGGEPRHAVAPWALRTRARASGTSTTPANESSRREERRRARGHERDRERLQRRAPPPWPLRAHSGLSSPAKILRVSLHPESSDRFANAGASHRHVRARQHGRRRPRRRPGSARALARDGQPPTGAARGWSGS